MQLRFVIRNGRRILQQLTIKTTDVSYAEKSVTIESKWIDVPLCNEYTNQEITDEEYHKIFPIQQEQIKPIYKEENFKGV